MKNSIYYFVSGIIVVVFVRNDDFFTNLKLAESFSADSIVAIDFVDKKDKILKTIKRKDCDSVEDFRCNYDSVAIA